MSERVVIYTQHIPPSINNCFANVRGKGRVRTERYRQWAQAAGYDFKRKGKVSGAFEVRITIDRQTRHILSDIDNRCKPCLDLLQEHGIIDDDRYCERATIEWGDAKGGMMICVEPYSEARAA